LIVVSRTLIDAQQKTDQQLNKLSAGHDKLRAEIDAELKALIKAVNSFLKRLPNGNA
jgi:flagellar hook-associated protein FlgK